MSNFSLLVSSVDPNDKAQLMAKAFVASKMLRILAIVAIAISLLIAVPIIILGGVIGSAGLAVSGIDGGEELAVAGGLLAFGAGMMVLLVAMIGQFFTLWYTSKLKQQLENNDIPSLVLPYIFLVITLFSIYGSIEPEFNLLGFILYGLVAFLWLVLISTVSKIKKLA